MLVKDLIGAELDFWVAKAEGKTDVELRTAQRATNQICVVKAAGGRQFDYTYSPSTQWNVGGPLIENKKIWISDEDDYWIASLPPHIDVDNGRELIQVGDTPLIAACRALVVSVFGDEV